MATTPAMPGLSQSLSPLSRAQSWPGLARSFSPERPGRNRAADAMASRANGGVQPGHDSTAKGTKPFPAGQAQSSPAMMKAAQDFEALAIGQLLQPMFDTVDTAHGPFGGGNAEAAWKPMLVDAIAKQVAARGGLGLAAPVFHELLRVQETQTGSSQP